MIKNIFSDDQKNDLTKDKFNELVKIINTCSTNQIAWISGYCWGLLNNKKNENYEEIKKITIISASQTGNARTIANNLYQELINKKIKVKLFNAGDYNFKKIFEEKYLIIITSTQGEGEPPEEAFALYDFLMSKRAPKFKNTYFAVFGLGDKSYEFFSKAGKDFDNRLFELGGKRLLNRVDADIQYQTDEQKWRESILKILDEKSYSLNINDNKIKKLNNVYSKSNPFFANIIKNQKITGKFSNKDVRHIEIDLGNSGISYTPGDALGIWYENDTKLVENFIDLFNLNKDHLLLINDKKISFYDALKKKFELTVNTNQITENFAYLSKNKKLLKIIQDKEKLKNFVQNIPIIEMAISYPCKLTENQLISFLRPLKPRFYSISSSQLENINEVHITVNIINFIINKRSYTGGASGYLSKQFEDNNVSIFIEKNNNFRLPSDSNAPIIMIGPGTGIAPFRAFIQHRYNQNAIGKNWLFFGNQQFTEDFLYQTEWQKYFESGFLNKISLAWSRDQKNKKYVQDKIKEKNVEIWQWIKEGAYIYICGNANNMAKDVEKTLLKEVFCKCGNMNIESSKNFLYEMRLSHRYQRDVY